MWSFKDLKSQAKVKLKKNYWLYLTICFLLAVFAFRYVTTNFAFNLDGTLKIFDVFSNLTAIESGEFKIALNGILDSLLQSNGYMVKVFISIYEFFKNHLTFGFLLIFAAFLEFLYYVFVANPLSVGGKKVFIEDALNKDSDVKPTSYGYIWYGFKNGNYSAVVKTMFFYNLYLSLWFFTVIGYFIKIYEYRMVPYILATSPNLSRKEVFAKSKAMMQGNKWRTFLLDLSFIGWNLLGVLTLGLLNIFFVNPYFEATNAELYKTLKGVN